MTEEEAINALRAGNHAGMDTLVALNQVRALRLAYEITGDRLAAEDCVADAFLKVHEGITKFQPDRPFAPWFFRIVVNNALTVARRAQRHNKVINLLAQHRQRVETPEDVAEQNEKRRRIIAAVRALPLKERTVLVLRLLLDMDERSVAETLSMPLGTVKTRLHRARLLLRRQLAELSEGPYPELEATNDRRG
jgi:RNA polymerase sigma-70 factor, ECF subfamily